MPRRLTLALPLMLLAILLVAPATAMAAPASSATTVLATEGHGEELPGTPAVPANDPDNPNPPEPYESPFLQNAAGALTMATIGLIAFIGLLYYLLVERPRAAKHAA